MTAFRHPGMPPLGVKENLCKTGDTGLKDGGHGHAPGDCMNVSSSRANLVVAPRER